MLRKKHSRRLASTKNSDWVFTNHGGKAGEGRVGAQTTFFSFVIAESVNCNSDFSFVF